MPKYLHEFVMNGSGDYVNETAGEALGKHKLVYRGVDGYWYLADADDAATMPVLGITMSEIAATRKGEILLDGYIGNTAWTWVAGGEIYASATVGDVTQTAPTGTGDTTQVVGVAVSATVIQFKPFDVRPAASYTDVTLSRDLDDGSNTNVYQNTTGRTMFVEVTCSLTITDNSKECGFTVYTDDDNTPTLYKMRAGYVIGPELDGVHTFNKYEGLTFVVLPGEYYKVDKDQGAGNTVTKYKWIEILI